VRDRDSSERLRAAGRTRAVGFLRLRETALFVERHKTVELRVQRLDALQKKARSLDARELPRGKRVGKRFECFAMHAVKREERGREQR
jgi:hypothetical protein